MDLISSVSPISPSKKVQHTTFGACRVFLGTNFLLGAASFALSSNCHQFSLSFGTQASTFFLQWPRLRRLILCKLSSLNSVHSPCLNAAHGISWSASGYLPKVRVRSNP